MSAKTFAKAILATSEYRASLFRRIALDELSPAVECLIYHYAYGKPVEHVAVTDVPLTFDDLSFDELEERACRTLEFIRQCRRPDSDSTDSVH